MKHEFEFDTEVKGPKILIDLYLAMRGAVQKELHAGNLSSCAFGLVIKERVSRDPERYEFFNLDGDHEFDDLGEMVLVNDRFEGTPAERFEHVFDWVKGKLGLGR